MKRRAGLTAILVALVIVVQVVLLICLAEPLSAVANGVGQVLDLLAQNEHPSLLEAVQVLRELALSLGIVVGASAAGCLVVSVIAVSVVRRGLKPTPKLRLAWRTRVNIVILWVLAVLLAFFVSLAVSSPTITMDHFSVRGASIAIAIPNNFLIGTVLILISAVIVLCSIATSGAAWHDAEPDAFRRSPVVGTGEHPQSRWPLMALSISGGILLALALVLLVPARPVSDDLRVLALARDQSFAEFMYRHLTEETGRYAQGVWNWAVGRLFGVHATQATGITVVMILWGSCAVTLQTCLRSRTTAIGLATVVTGAGVWSVPSFVDGFTWFTAANVYVPGVAGLIVSASVAWRLWTAEVVRWYALAGCLLLVGVTCGFYEGVTIVAVLGAITMTVVAMVTKHRRVVSLSILAVSVIGLTMMLLAPAQLARVDAVNSSSILVAMAGSGYSCLHLVVFWSAADWLILVGAGIGVGTCLTTALGLSHCLRVALAGVALSVIAPLIFGGVGFYGLAWAVWRLYTPQAILSAWGIIMFIAGVVASSLNLARRKAVGQPRVLRVIVVPILMLGLIFVAPEFARLSTALGLRSSLVSSRDALVVSQLADGSSQVDIVPAPLLYYPTDARDFEFLEEQNTDWFSFGYRQWFQIPNNTTVVFDTRQPVGYCVDDPRIVLPNVASCADLLVSQ